MTEQHKLEFFEHAMKEVPREACALIIVEHGREKLVLCKNLSVLNDQFELDPRDYARAEIRGEVVAVVHSHCYTPATPSEHDRVSCEGSDLPWFICSVPTGAWAELKPSGYKAPLIGRTWAHGTLDCFGLVRDYYAQTLNIEVPDFHRELNFWEKGQDPLNVENFAKAGFFEVPFTDLQEHDGLILQIHSKVANHCGVYLGNDIFLHHLTRRLSSRDVFAGYYRKHCVRVMRHKARP